MAPYALGKSLAKQANDLQFSTRAEDQREMRSTALGTMGLGAVATLPGVGMLAATSGLSKKDYAIPEEFSKMRKAMGVADGIKVVRPNNPMAILQGPAYNPIGNEISAPSRISETVMAHELGHAKDYAKRGPKRQAAFVGGRALGN